MFFSVRSAQCDEIDCSIHFCLNPMAHHRWGLYFSHSLEDVSLSLSFFLNEKLFSRVAFFSAFFPSSAFSFINILTIFLAAEWLSFFFWQQQQAWWKWIELNQFSRRIGATFRIFPLKGTLPHWWGSGRMKRLATPKREYLSELSESKYNWRKMTFVKFKTITIRSLSITKGTPVCWSQTFT